MSRALTLLLAIGFAASGASAADTTSVSIPTGLLRVSCSPEGVSTYELNETPIPGLTGSCASIGGIGITGVHRTATRTVVIATETIAYNLQAIRLISFSTQEGIRVGEFSGGDVLAVEVLDDGKFHFRAHGEGLASARDDFATWECLHEVDFEGMWTTSSLDQPSSPDVPSSVCEGEVLQIVQP